MVRPLSSRQTESAAGPPLAMLVSTVFDSLVEALHVALPAAGFPDIRPAHSINLFRVIDPEGTRPTELARRAGITPQAMAEIVRYLEARGYAERVPDASDGRGRIVKLTARGQEASMVAGRVFGDLETKWEDQLGARRMIQLRRTLSELANLET
jgi:DNA-binding MarR family transcriptional regulator